MFVEDAYAFMYHEESLVTMHGGVGVASDRGASRLEDQARLARGKPDSSYRGGLRVLVFLLDSPVADDQWAESSSKPLLWLGEVCRGKEVRHRGCTHGHGTSVEEMSARCSRYPDMPGQTP